MLSDLGKLHWFWMGTQLKLNSQFPLQRSKLRKRTHCPILLNFVLSLQKNPALDFYSQSRYWCPDQCPSLRRVSYECRIQFTTSRLEVLASPLRNANFFKQNKQTDNPCYFFRICSPSEIPFCNIWFTCSYKGSKLSWGRYLSLLYANGLIPCFKTSSYGNRLIILLMHSNIAWEGSEREETEAANQ